MLNSLMCYFSYKHLINNLSTIAVDKYFPTGLSAYVFLRKFATKYVY